MDPSYIYIGLEGNESVDKMVRKEAKTPLNKPQTFHRIKSGNTARQDDIADGQWKRKVVVVSVFNTH